MLPAIPTGALQCRLLLTLLLWPAVAPAQQQDAAPAMSAGEYAFTISGCTHCHTADGGETLAGGRPLPTPFGTFFTPNISAHESAGIGRWSREDFRRALKAGESPAGHAYFPAFPYPAYARLTDADVDAIYDHIFTLPVSARANREHELAWYVDTRLAAWGWRFLFFDESGSSADPARAASSNRGAYIAEAMAHCQECHTPRNWFGVLDDELAYAGNPAGPEDEVVPNITSHPDAGIGGWSDAALDAFLRWGELPDGEYTAGSMEAVIFGIGKLTDDDRAALIEYLRSLRAIDSRVE